MENNLPITDEEWEKLRESSFNAEAFLKGLKMFDSICHIAGNSDFSANVREDMRKLGELAGYVFADGRRDSVGDLFSLASPLNVLMGDMETWIEDVRRALASLEKLRPKSLDKPN